MTTTKTDHRSLVALKLPTRVQALITYATGIVTALTGNPYFPTIVPTLVTLTAAIAALQTAETAALARAKGAVITRNEKRLALVQLLQQLKGPIQAAADANLENGASIIASAGVAVKKTVVRSPRVFGAKPGDDHRHGEARHRVGGAPGVVRVGVQHGRRQDLGDGAGDAAGEDDRHRADGGDDGAVPEPGGDEDRRRQLDAAGVAGRAVAGGVVAATCLA